MKSPPLPVDEETRLLALREYQILDTPPELDFDEIVELAARICGTSMATMSLVDAGRQWFKSRHHVDFWETPREHAFCAHAICASEQLFVVPDATVDERFHDNPLVIDGPKLRFYAGAQLKTPAGRVVGMLCVLDKVPRELCPEQKTALLTLSRQIMARLELRRLLAAQQGEIAARGGAEAELRRRDAILEAANFASETMLNADDYEATIQSALERVARATQSDFASVWQLHPTEGESGLLKLRHAWAGPAMPTRPDGGPPAIPWGPNSGLPKQELLRNKIPIQGNRRTGSPDELRLLEKIGVKSFICLPIFALRDRFWGLLALGSVRPDVQWCPASIDALRSATRVLWALTHNRVTEAALRASEERFRALSAAAPIGIFETDATAQRNRYSNQRLQTILGLSEAEINNGRWKEIVHPGDRAAVDAVWTEACRAGTTAMLQYRVLRADGIRWVKTVASPTRDSTGAVVSYVGAVDDMTDSHLTTEALRQSESKYRTVVTTLKEVVFQIDRDGRWTYLNPAWTEIVGYRVEENVGTPFLQYVHPDDRAGSQQFFLSLIQNQRESCRNELRALTKDGSFRWVEVFAQVRLDEGNRVVGVTGTLNDITTRKEAETRIEASLREKEVLLKEVNHRVKNNLQVISSLLNLQRDQICDEKARELFTDAQSRIESMALVHEKLYQSSDLGRIDFADYLRDLTDNLGGLMGHRARNLSLKLESTGLQLGVDTAIPCGLIINELVTNAYKHAFPAGGQGHVVVAISRVNNGRLRLMVADDGCGLPVDMDLRQTRSLGLRLVHTLVQQLRGTLVVERERGTRFVLHLEEVRRRERPVA